VDLDLEDSVGYFIDDRDCLRTIPLTYGAALTIHLELADPAGRDEVFIEL
jgi:hypothetical protein